MGDVTMIKDEVIKDCIELYKQQQNQFQIFINSIRDFFLLDPPTNDKNVSVIHSIKYRLKDPEHLADKISRKWSNDNPIDKSNLFSRVTDLAGLRVLHLYQDQFPLIHERIMEKVNSKEWFLAEDPKAYTWDPETERFFENLGIHCQQKESFYTSIHYLVKKREDDFITCEIQVRTLFEEIWGEIDHTINYPHPTDSIACKEQLRVLSKLVSTGTRLADSIFRTYNDYTFQIKENVRDGADTDSIKTESGRVDSVSLTHSSIHHPKILRQYLLGGNSNWYDQVKANLEQVKSATFMWPNGYWPFEKLAPTEKPVPGDIFIVGYGKSNQMITGKIQYAGIKLLTDIIQENERSINRINCGFKDNNELRNFVNNRREIGCITIDNIQMISLEDYQRMYGEYKKTHTVRENSLFIYEDLVENYSKSS